MQNHAAKRLYLCCFRSKSIGIILSKIDAMVNNHNALSIPGTTSIKAAQSSASTHVDTRLYSAVSVNAVSDNPAAIASL